MIEKSVGEPLRGLVILLILKRKLRISVGTQAVRKTQMTAQFSHFRRRKQEPWMPANCTCIVIGFMKNKNYIKLLFKKKFTFMNKYSLRYSQSSGKGRNEVTFANSPL